MINGILKFTALLALAVGALFAVPALATAGPTPDHCKAGEINSLARRCIPPSYSASPTCHYKCPSASASPSVGPTLSPTPTHTSTLHTTGPAEPSPAGGALPVTGAKTDWMIGGGLAFVAAGAVGVLVGRKRRNRISFEA